MAVAHLSGSEKPAEAGVVQMTPGLLVAVTAPVVDELKEFVAGLDREQDCQQDCQVKLFADGQYVG